FPIQINNCGERTLFAKLEFAGRERERTPITQKRFRKSEAALFVQSRHSDLPLVVAQSKNFHLSIIIPIRRREIGNASERRESPRRIEGAILALKIKRQLAAFRFGDKKVGAPVAI